VVLTVVANICDVVRASVKSRDVLQEAQDVEIPKGLEWTQNWKRFESKNRA